jgi:hypothetical protein
MTESEMLAKALDMILGAPTVQPKTYTRLRLDYTTQKLTVPLDLHIARPEHDAAQVEVEDLDRFFTPQRRERLRAYLEELVEEQMAQNDAERP